MWSKNINISFNAFINFIIFHALRNCIRSGPNGRKPNEPIGGMVERQKLSRLIHEYCRFISMLLSFWIKTFCFQSFDLLTHSAYQPFCLMAFGRLNHALCIYTKSFVINELQLIQVASTCCWNQTFEFYILSSTALEVRTM